MNNILRIKEIRSSWQVRLISLCFIFFILLGNFWLVYLVTSAKPPSWIGFAFIGCVLGSFFGALAILPRIISVLRNGFDNHSASDQELNDTH